MHMRLQVRRHAPPMYLMSVGARDTGWYSTGRLGLCGFADRGEARRAGEIAAAILVEWYRVRWHRPPEAWPDDVAPEHALGCDGVTVGRVVPQHPLVDSAAPSWGIELRLPDDTWIAVMLELAQRMHGAVAEPPLPAA